MKVFPIYIVFEASILYREAEQAIELIKRTIVRFRTNPYDLEIVSLGIMAYQADVHIIRKLTPIIDIDYQIDTNQLLKLFDSQRYIEPNFEKMIDALIAEISEINPNEARWGYTVIIIADDYKLSMLYKGLGELHAQFKDIEVSLINTRQGHRSDQFMCVKSLDHIENIGYSLFQYYEGDLDNYYPKNQVRMREI